MEPLQKKKKLDSRFFSPISIIEQWDNKKLIDRNLKKKHDSYLGIKIREADESIETGLVKI